MNTQGSTQKNIRDTSPPLIFFDFPAAISIIALILENSLNNLVRMPEAVLGISFQLLTTSVRERVVCEF